MKEKFAVSKPFKFLEFNPQRIHSNFIENFHLFFVICFVKQRLAALILTSHSL